MTGLLTTAEVAERLGLSAELVKRRTALEDWPCVRFSARTIRYREEHVDQIIARFEHKPDPVSLPVSTGQTARSRARAARS